MLAVPTCISESPRGFNDATLGALATWNSAHKSLWMDEAYSEYTTRLPLMGAIHRSLRPPSARPWRTSKLPGS